MIINLEILFEYMAVALVMLGVWFIANVDITGQYCMLAAQVLWLFIGWKTKMRGLMLQSFVLFILTCRAICQWLPM